jgi:sugar/nucleoside kinase (ribokinase family)
MGALWTPVPVCALGDLLLDVVVRLDAPLADGDDTAAETRFGAGGQAANVAAWVAALGEEARFVGKRSGDAAGRLLEDELRARGVELAGPVAEGRTGVVVSMVGPDGGRTMASDRGVSPLLGAWELDMRWFRDCSWLHLSGYSLLRSPIDEAGAKAAGAVRALGGKVSVDLASASLIRGYGPDRLLARLRLLAPDVVFANDDEVEAIGDDLPAATLVRKRGAEGIVVDGVALPAAPAEVVDSTGAGDALAAGYIVGGPQLALETAARCVSRLGAMP